MNASDIHFKGTVSELLAKISIVVSMSQGLRLTLTNNIKVNGVTAEIGQVFVFMPGDTIQIGRQLPITLRANDLR